jgi:DNA-binding NtrC family response regulator
VRQLAVEAQRLAVRATEGVVHLSHLSREVREALAAPCPGSLRDARAEFDRAYVWRALEHNQWNRTATARRLGISRQALACLIRRLGLRVPPPKPPSPSGGPERLN